MYGSRYNVLDALVGAALLAFLVVCFQQGGFPAGMVLLMLIVLSVYLGYKTAYVHMRHEAERGDQ